MKSLLIIAIIIFAAFVFINNFEPTSEYAKISREKVVAPFRYAALLASAPEEKIQIPIRPGFGLISVRDAG